MVTQLIMASGATIQLESHDDVSFTLGDYRFPMSDAVMLMNLIKGNIKKFDDPYDARTLVKVLQHYYMFDLLNSVKLMVFIQDEIYRLQEPFLDIIHHRGNSSQWQL